MAINLQIENLTKSFGNLTLFRNLCLTLEENQRTGLIAQNGTGKSTLLQIIAGDEGYDSGNIILRNDLRIGYLRQDPKFGESKTVIEACLMGQEDIASIISDYEKALASGDSTQIDSAMQQMEHRNAWDIETRMQQILSKLKIKDFNQPISQLSGGQLKRVALASVLTSEPELLILDEPTNHLDTEMIEWLEEYLSKGNISLLVVTHDRYFLDRVCNDIIEIDNETLYRYKGNYSYYLAKREERVESENTEIARAQNLMRKELDWMRRQPQARATKAKYRIDAFYKLQDTATKQQHREEVKLNVKSTYIGSKIFEMTMVNKSFDNLIITKKFSYNFSRFEKLGIIGDNGTGKSTFIKMLLGKVTQDSGKIDIGETVRFGYYSQDGMSFDENTKVIDVVRSIAEIIPVGNKNLTASQLLQHFLFTPETQHNYVYKLSGGEKRRLYLCTVLMGNPNFLVLDEPTNDLDITTLQVLEDYLQNFTGCLIVISHDRYFMDRIVDHIFVFRGEGEIKDFPGNYTDYRDYLEEEKSRIAETEKKGNEEKKNTTNRQNNITEKKKLTFKEKREYEALETEIGKLESEKSTLEERMNSGTLNSEQLFADSKRISEIIELIDIKSTRWLELSEYE